MEKTRKTLNLIALAIFLSSNFLTPLSYAVDDLGVIRDETAEIVGETEQIEAPQNDNDTEGDTPVNSSLDVHQDDEDKGDEIVEDEDSALDVMRDVVNDSQVQESDDRVILEDSDEREINEGATVEYHPENEISYTLNENEDFTAGTITVTNGETTITILDRNLGATATGTGCEDPEGEMVCEEGDPTYGYLFQWGNNYGFISEGEVIPGEQIDETQVSASDVGPNYSSGVFHYYLYNWIDDDAKVDMWGGGMTDSTDTTYSLSDGTWKVNPDTVSSRQGPCPEGFHVPSRGELDKLKTMMGSASAMHNDLKIPFAGWRDYESYQGYLGTSAHLWSSSPASNSESRDLYRIVDGDMSMDESYRVNAYSVRCIYDEYAEYQAPTPAKTITFDLNGGYWTEDGPTATANKTKQFGGEAEGSLTDRKTPSKLNVCGENEDKKCMFAGWYLTGLTTRREGDVSSDLTVYAKWLEFEDWNITGTDYVIMDRNIGATAAGILCEYGDQDACGYNFQWGNNYGFDVDDIIDGISTTVGVSSYSPSTYYSNKWITRTPWWGDDYNLNLWGGTSDNEEDRQGPCPGGYHIPTRAEYSDLGAQLDLGEDGAQLRDRLNLPYARYRSDAGNLRTDSYGMYRSSSPYEEAPDDQENEYFLNFWDDHIYWNDRDIFGSQGFSVRCFQNAPETKTVTYNPNGGAFSGMVVGDVQDVVFTKDGNGNYVPDINIQFPNKSGYMFDGWYTSSSNQIPENEWIGYVTDDTTVTEAFAKWLEFEDLDLNFGGARFTIMDRNLGAEAYINEDGKTADQWYGKYYQWGNNYGFAGGVNGDTLSNVSNTPVAVAGYGPGNYYSRATFITQYTWASDDDYESYNDNLWGGEGDAEHYDDDSETYDYDSGNDRSLRQGPCPEGYHVPSQKEWSDIYNAWCDANEEDCEAGDMGERFGAILKLPFAGYRDYNDSMIDRQGESGYYWTSSRSSYESAFEASIESSSVDVGAYNYDATGGGNSLRCFKDEANVVQQFTVTFNPNNDDAPTIENVVSGDTVGALSPVPKKSGYRLKGWYTTSTFDDGTQVTFPYTVTENVQLYAKWQDTRCEGEKDWYTEFGACATKNVDNVYYWTDEKGKDVISVIINGTVLTMLDKNEGAENVGDYGHLYQWGNNAAIETATSEENVGAEYKNYRPGHPFSEAKFRYGNSMLDYWQNDNYNYLWGGEGDGYTSNIDTFWGGIKNGSIRQGPCPDGYHVPSMGEWNTLVTYRYNMKAGGSWSYTDLFRLDDNNMGVTFRTAFKLPLAGYRNYPNASKRDQNVVGYYWSSSPDMNASSKAHYLVVNYDLDATYNGGRAFGFSVRCFKDSTEVPEPHRVTFQANGGNLLGAPDGTLLQLVEDGKKAQTPIEPTSNEAGKTFSHWENVNGGSEFVLSNVDITEDVTLRAIYTDSTKPVCNITTQPTSTPISLVNGYNQGTVTFTCTDGVGVATNNISASNIAYNSNIVTLSNFTPGGTPTDKTFTFTYTAKAQGSTTLSLKAGAVSDAAGNTNDATVASSTVTVDTTAPTINITEPSAGTWTKSKTVSATVEDASSSTMYYSINTNGTCTSATTAYTPGQALSFTQELDNGKYVCYRAVDSAGNEAYLPSAKVEKIDTTAPTLVNKTPFENTWYTQNPTSTFTYTDGEGSGISGTNTRTCQITQEGSASTCKITNVSVCDIAGNCNTDDQTSNPAKLDRTQPVCGTWTYQPLSQTNTGVTATLAGSTDATSGIKKAGGTCTLTSNDTTCDVIIEDNAGLTRVCTSQSVNNIDKVKPEGTIQVVTSTPKSTTQEVKLICSDNVGVSSYYWGTSSNPVDINYRSIINVQTNYEVTKTVDAAGTYYLLCKDEAGNISDSKSQVYNSYEVHNMLNAVDKEESTYNSTNYPQDGSTATYIAPEGTILAFVDVYTVPGYSAANMYKGYTTAASGTPDTRASVTLDSNPTYYFWFDRIKYDLNLVKNTGIETIYYKVDGADSYSNTGVTTSVPMKAGSNAYAYAIASSGYTLTGDFIDYDENTPWERDDVLANQEFSPNTIMNEYTVTWKDYDGSELSGAVYHYNDDLIIPSNPSRAEDSSYTYTFKGWNPEPVEKVIEDVVYTAEYEAISRGGRSSGGGGRSKETPSPIDVVEETVHENTHNAADEKEAIESKTETGNEEKTNSSETSDTRLEESKYTQEFVEAYEFAKKNGVTTMQTIDKAKMNSEMIRIEMAKMLSNYAINVLGKKPDTTKKVKFNDVSSKLDKQYDEGVTLAYQLGIMGQNMPKNHFRPHDKVSRAEFVTALSRMIYNTPEGTYKGTRNYYASHIAKLYNEGIINKTDPSMKEKRGYVMIMLMRTVK